MLRVLLIVIVHGLLTVTGAFLAWNGIRKIFGFAEFASAVEDYAPRARGAGIARIWVAFEIAAGLALVVPFPHRAVLATAALSAATGAVARRASQGERHDCGCAAGLTTRSTSPRAVAGNCVVIGALAALAYAGTPAIETGAALAGAMLGGFVFGFAAVGGDAQTDVSPTAEGPSVSGGALSLQGLGASRSTR